MINWATVPTTISESAVEIRNQIDSSVAINARISHNAAENQTCSMPVLPYSVLAVGIQPQAPTALFAIGVIGR
jgi:hypothetical protein